MTTHRNFFYGATQREALARLNYVVGANRHCVTLTGPAGTGKSALLRVFREERLREHGLAVLIDLTARDAADVLRCLAEGLGSTVRAPHRESALWREVADALAGNRLAGRSVVVLFDHVDLAPAESHQIVRRLLAEDDGPDVGATYVLAFSGRGFPVIANPWREMSELRIELKPLSGIETTELVRAVARGVDLSADVFDDSAADALFRLTRGRPREVIRLCEISLLSAMRDEQQIVSREIVESAVRELGSLRPSA